MKNKITFVINGLGGGGAERVCINLANKLIYRNIEVDIIVKNNKNHRYKEEIDSNINIINLEVSSMKKSIFKLKNYIKENNPEIIMSFNYEMSIILILIRFIYKLKFKLISRCINTLSFEKKYEKSIFRKLIVYPLVKMLYCKSDKIIAQSKGMADDLIKNYNIIQENIKVINNPIADKIYEFSIYNHKEVKNKKEKKKILFVGRLEKQKGIYMLLEGFKKIKDKECILNIIGEGKEKNNILQYISREGLLNRVNVINFSDNIEKYYIDSDITVLTSYFEGFPNVLIESITIGTPVVAFDCPSGPSEIIEKDINGILVKYLDIDDLVNKIDYALEKKWNSNKVIESSKKYRSEIIFKQYYDLINNI